VQSVTYDCRRLAVDDEPKYNLTFTRMWSLSATIMISRSGIVDMTEVLSQRRALQRTFLDPDSDATAEEEQLRSCFSAYVRLHRIVVKGSHGDKLRTTRFHRQMVVKAQLIPNTYASYLTEKRVKLILVALQNQAVQSQTYDLRTLNGLH
jgi:hypothetical protein